MFSRLRHPVRGQLRFDAAPVAERDAQSPFARVRENLSAREVEHVARCERDLQTAYVTARRAVLEGARAGTVRRHGRAEIATALGRVGRVEQAARFHRALKIREHDARLRRRAPAVRILHDLADASQFIRCQHDAAERHATAHQTRARARHSDRHALARGCD
jgi:hypothetical protein